jgi:hypothetical protein
MSSRAGCQAAILGAIVANPLLFPLTYLCGAIFGAHGFNNGGSAGFAGVKTGAEGGLVAVQMLVLSYLLTSGILAVVVSFVGAIIAPALAFGWCCLFRKTLSRPPTVSANTQMDAGTALDRPPA